MNLKIALATALLITGGTYAANAQQKTAVPQVTAAAKSFDTKVKEYQNADATKSAALLAELKQMMGDQMGTLKTEMATADAATREKLMKKNESRMNTMNEATRLMDAGGDKKVIVAALKKYAQTL